MTVQDEVNIQERSINPKSNNKMSVYDLHQSYFRKEKLLPSC